MRRKIVYQKSMTKNIYKLYINRFFYLNRELIKAQLRLEFLFFLISIIIPFNGYSIFIY